MSTGINEHMCVRWRCCFLHSVSRSVDSSLFFFFWLISSRCFLCCSVILCVTGFVHFDSRLLRESSSKYGFNRPCYVNVLVVCKYTPVSMENTLCIATEILLLLLLLILFMRQQLHRRRLLLLNKVQCQRHRWFAFLNSAHSVFNSLACLFALSLAFTQSSLSIKSVKLVTKE